MRITTKETGIWTIETGIGTLATGIKTLETGKTRTGTIVTGNKENNYCKR